MDFFENLNAKYNTLTTQGKKIADNINQNPDKTIRMTAKVLGEASGASASAVIRLCQRLGYESLEIMKIHIAKSLNKDELAVPIDTVISGGNTLTEVAQKLYASVQDTMLRTINMLDYEALKESVAILQKASRVYLFAIGGSALAAEDMCHKFNRIGKPCIFFQDGHTSLEFVSVVGKRDAVVAISYSGETKEVYLAAKGSLEKGAKVISITRDRTNTLSAFSTVILNIPEVEKRVRVGVFGSKFSQMFITDVLYLSMLQKNFDEFENMLTDASRIVNQLRG